MLSVPPLRLRAREVNATSSLRVHNSLQHLNAAYRYTHLLGPRMASDLTGHWPGILSCVTSTGTVLQQRPPFAIVEADGHCCAVPICGIFVVAIVQYNCTPIRGNRFVCSAVTSSNASVLVAWTPDFASAPFPLRLCQQQAKCKHPNHQYIR